MLKVMLQWESPPAHRRQCVLMNKRAKHEHLHDELQFSVQCLSQAVLSSVPTCIGPQEAASYQRSPCRLSLHGHCICHLSTPETKGGLFNLK